MKGILYRASMSDETRRFAYFAAGVAAILGLLWFAMTQIAFVSTSSRIEQLRSDSARVDGKMAEDVVGQITHLNQVIAEYKRWRRTVFKIFIPSEWDSVEFIDLLKEPEKNNL